MNELQEQLVHQLGLVRLRLVPALVGVEKLQVRQRIFLQVTVLGDRERVVLAEHVDHRDRQLVQSAFQVRLLAVVRITRVLAHERLGRVQRILLLHSRHRAHLEQVSRDRLLAIDDRVHQRLHAFFGAVEARQVDTRLELARIDAHGIAESARGDQRHPDHALGVVDREIDRGLRAIRVA